MTLVYNEIQVLSSLNESILLFAADTRLSTPNRKYSKQRKLFEIEYLRGGVSYFGLPFVFPKPTQRLALSEWLPSFIRNHSHLKDLMEFAQHLRNELAKVVPPKILSKHHSGFHLAAYTPDGLPDFVYFSNIGSGANFQYTDLHSEYSQPSSHFLERDARGHGWNGTDPYSIQSTARIYRNGDIYAHGAAWKRLDRIFDLLFQHPNFQAPISILEYERYVDTKLRVIAYLYKRHARDKVVGAPFDVFSYSTLK